MSNDKEKIYYIIHQLNLQNKDITWINKILYACELKSIATFKRRFSDFSILHYEHGPFCPELYEIKEHYRENNIGDTFEQVANKLDDNEKILIDEIITKWKTRGLGSAKQRLGLMGYVYNTLPFVLTPFGKQIEFEKYFDDELIDDPLIKKKEYKTLDNYIERNKDTLLEMIDTIDFDKLEKEILEHVESQ